MVRNTMAPSRMKKMTKPTLFLLKKPNLTNLIWVRFNFDERRDKITYKLITLTKINIWL